MPQGKKQVKVPINRDPSDLFQREVRRAIKELDDPNLHRVYIRGVALSTTTTQVKHGLGRIPTGWAVTDITENAVVYRDSTASMTKDIIPLLASASVTVDLVFW